jgi:bifunctional DNA-binding transcriptional regulator/antitoxin component of YhaV-PrlF toxin-antitoxin module
MASASSKVTSKGQAVIPKKLNDDGLDMGKGITL